MIKIFVYGSLMKDGHYHQHYLQGKTFLGKGYINEYKKYFLGGLHGILPKIGGSANLDKVIRSYPCFYSDLLVGLGSGTNFNNSFFCG